MKLLLDTHIWIWANRSPEQLSPTVRRQIANPRNELYLSPVSIWEAGNLHRRGRLLIKKSFSEWLDKFLSRLPVQEAPFNFAVAREAAQIRLPEADPGDTILAATASA